MISLANKYRPKTFEDVCGQSVTTEILKHELATGDIPAALGFFGASGCGKTTIARIVANILNEGKGHPIEQDAASNNSVDDVRLIIENAKQRSLDSKYKIFIIDECHGISSQGWQSFLKLLEEPNKYTKFIFCTTNPEKIPETVLSRLQIFNFSKISDELIFSNLQKVCLAENIIISDESLNYISRLSNGSMRQALANLEKCISKSNNVEYNDVVSAIGSADFDTFCNLFTAIATKDARSSVSIIEKAYKDGKDIKLFTFEFLKFILDLSKASIFDKDFSVTNLPNTESVLKLFDYSDRFNSILNFITELFTNLRTASDARFILESKLVTLCLSE